MENDKNVISLGDIKVNKRRGRPKKDDKISEAMKQDMISHYIDNTIQNPVGQPPKRKFVCLAPNRIQKLVYEITEDKEVIFSDELAVKNMLGSSIKDHFVNDPDLHMSEKQYKACVDYWKIKTEPMEKPKMISWKGEDCLSFRKLPFEIGLGETPKFDELMSRTKNSQALMMFIGSLLDPESGKQQYIYWHGQGKNGKGAMTEILMYVFGHLYASEVPPCDGNRRFWAHGIRDKRIVVFEDCNDAKFVASGLFKSLTGGGATRIEQKQGQVWSEVLDAKFIFCSNEKPEISSEIADRRRIIFCETGEFNGDKDPKYVEYLKVEAGYFITKCYILYKEKCPNHEDIKCDTVSIDDLIDVNEESYSVFLENRFHYGINPVTEKLYQCLSKDFLPWVKYNFKTRREQNDFKKWLERRHKIFAKNVRTENKVNLTWIGLEPKQIYLGEI